jgi:uncharacterized protein
MRWILSLVVALASVVSASAQETATFRARVGAGRVSGTETYTISSTASAHEVAAEITMRPGGTEAHFVFKETLNGAWEPVNYRVEMSGGLGNATATAERKGSVLALAVKTPGGTPTQEVPASPNLVLMDNMLAAPYQVLLNLTTGRPGPVVVVVPFQMATVPGTLESAGTITGTLDGKPVVATKLLLKVATVTTEVYADQASRRLLRVFVPAQDAEIVREGFVPSTVAAPTAAPRPAGVAERDVTFKTIDGSPYPAVLCLPSGSASAPLVVLIHGSGPQDRDETIGPNKPFRDIAWGLAEQGIATLRYDKRTRAFPKSYKGSLDSESIDDAVDAVAFARTLDGIDKSKLFVLGHSLGGLAATYVVQRAPVAGMILMASPGRPMDQVIRDQVRTLNAPLGEAKVAEVLKMQDEIMEKVRAGTATSQELQGQPVGAIRDMIVRDPIVELEKSRTPMLVLKGDKDAQVFQADFDALQAVAASRPGSAARLLPGLTHIFTPTSGPAEVRAIYEPARVPAAVITLIAGWVKDTR